MKRFGGKARVKKISSLPGDSPPRSPSTLCLGSDLLSSPHASSLSSALPSSASLSSSSPLSVPSALDVVSSENYAHKPSPTASPFSANPTCPASRGSLGRRTPFDPPFGEGPLPQPPQASARPGMGGARKTSATATRPASSNSEAADQYGHGCLPSYGFPQGKRDRNAARFAIERGRGDNRHLVASDHCGYGCPLPPTPPPTSLR